MSIFRNKKVKKFAVSSMLLGLIVTGIAFSVAWFDPTDNSFEADITGSVVEEYFHTGSGTANDPFVITRPIHYFHLVEFYQRNTILPVNGVGNKTFGSDYIYFQVGYPLVDGSNEYYVYNYDNSGTFTGGTTKELNLAYYSGDNALMPIGTSEVPFIGLFDGKGDQGIKIKNLNICCQEDVYLYGQTQTTLRKTSDVGIFGYIKDDTGGNTTSIHDCMFDNVEIDLTGIDKTVTTSTHTSAHTDKAYVGYLVGHIHSYFNYGYKENENSTPLSHATPIYHAYVNNCTIKGAPSVHCNFGYFGNVDTVDGDAPSPISTTIGGGEGPGQGDDWGGSINMRSLNNRIWNLLNAPNDVKTDNPNTQHPTSGNRANDVALQPSGKTYSSYSNYHRYYYDDYNYVSVENAVGESSYNNRNPETNSNIYRLAGNCTIYNHHKEVTSYHTITLPGTVLPLAVGEKSDGYSVLNKNTGYIVSGMSGSGSYTAQTTIRVASSPIGTHIGNSLSSSGRDSTGYTSSQLEVIGTTNPGAYNSSNFSRIKDNYNKNNSSVSSAMSSKYNSRAIDSASLAKYDAAREQLDEILEGQSFAHGLHFTGSSISSSTTINMPTAVINGQSYSSYALPKNSIDFNLKESGYINFFAGSYQHNTTNTCDSFFSLHVVKRNSSNSITSISEISKIYNNTNDATKAEFPYVYQFTDNTNYAGSKNGADVAFTKGSTVVYDMQYLWNAPAVDYAIYYFEVPVNAGEFAMGSHSGKDKGTYLIYLDLSANGDEQEETGGYASIFTQVDFRSSYLTSPYYSCFNIAYVIPEGSDKNKFSIKISTDSSYSYSNKTYYCYQIEITNISGSSFEFSCLLSDNNDNHTDEYLIMYEITYNGGTPQQFIESKNLIGATGATSVTENNGS